MNIHVHVLHFVSSCALKMLDAVKNLVPLCTQMQTITQIHTYLIEFSSS